MGSGLSKKVGWSYSSSGSRALVTIIELLEEIKSAARRKKVPLGAIAKGILGLNTASFEKSLVLKLMHKAHFKGKYFMEHQK